MEDPLRDHSAKTMATAWQQSKNLGDCMVELYDKRLWTDIKFRCKDHDENERIHAHKIVLAARSPVFQAIFFGPCADSKSEVELENTEAKILDLFLRYIYSDKVNLTKDIASPLFQTAHYYQVQNLELICTNYLTTNLTSENACEILSLAMLYKVTTLRDACCTFIDKNANSVLNSEGFLELSLECLTYILKGDTFYAAEVDIFRKVEEWLGNKKLKDGNLENTKPNPRLALGEAFYYLRFPRMTIRELMNCTRKKGYFSVEEYEDIVDFINNVPSSSVKSNSCIKRLGAEETLYTGSDSTYFKNVTAEDSISTRFQIFVSEDVKLTNICLKEIRIYLEHDKTFYSDESRSLSRKLVYDSVDLFLCLHNGNVMKIESKGERYRDKVYMLEEVLGQDLPQNFNVDISGCLKIKCPESKLFKVNDGACSEENEESNQQYKKIDNNEEREKMEYCNRAGDEKEDEPDSGDESQIFEQTFKLKSSDISPRMINLREPLTLTKASSPYTAEVSLKLVCESRIKMKVHSIYQHTVRSRFGHMEVRDIEGQFAGIKSIGFEKKSNRETV